MIEEVYAFLCAVPEAAGGVAKCCCQATVTEKLKGFHTIFGGMKWEVGINRQ